MQISKISDDYHNQHKEFRKLTYSVWQIRQGPQNGRLWKQKKDIIHHEGALTYFLFLFLARL